MSISQAAQQIIDAHPVGLENDNYCQKHIETPIQFMIAATDEALAMLDERMNSLNEILDTAALALIQIREDAANNSGYWHVANGALLSMQNLGWEPQ